MATTHAFGVDIGGTTIKMGLFQTDGKLIEDWEIPTRTQENGAGILSDIAEAIKAKRQQYQIPLEDIAGIGVGVPGPVSPDGVVHGCINLGWGTFNISSQLSQLSGLKVQAGNDADVAALGEMWQGGGKGHNSIVMMTLGTGVGGGVVLNGQIVLGRDGAAGEIGHLPLVEGETETCACGRKGCLEQYASANGIVRITKRYLAAHEDVDTALRKVDNLTSKEILDAAREGDAVALEMMNTVTDLLGRALASIACVVNPEAFVIGGGMSKAGTFLLEAIRERFTLHAFPALQDTPLLLASLGNRAGIYGGVRMVLASA